MLDGQEAARAGMQRAEDHAERVSAGWKVRAAEFLNSYALRHKTFTAETVIGASAGVVPNPPDSRAWGAVFARAARAGIITLDGFENAQRAQVHRQIVRRWRSTRYWEP